MRRKARRFRRPLLAVSLLVLGPIAFYVAFLLIGSWPVNRGFVESPEGVAIYIWSDAVHTDLIVPIRNEIWDWSTTIDAADFAGDTAWATHYAIGWGDRGFYLDTPTWSDLKATTAVNALILPSGTVMHVRALTEPRDDERYHRVMISTEQYERLSESIRLGFKSQETRPAAIAGEAFGDHDVFYPARGRYYAFYTCNSWAGDRLEHAGVCVPWWSPLPGSTTWYLDTD